MTHTLKDGTTLPAVGFGTYPLKGEEGVTALVSALEVGYRYLDSAVNYENETEVGEALRRSGVPREEVVLATKVPGRFHERELALRSLADSAQRLGVERIDVGLIHWPNPSRDLYVDAWRALVEAQQEGLVTHIGVSNFTAAHLDRIIDETDVTPAINQIELHPRFPQAQMRAANVERGILTQAWSPLGKREAPFDEPAVVTAAERLGVSPAQVLLAWHLAVGSMPLPKSATPERQRANLDVSRLALTNEEVAAISDLGRADGRLFDGDPDTHEEM
jgi:2,5-diketo-D-gluconate reductase A